MTTFSLLDNFYSGQLNPCGGGSLRLSEATLRRQVEDSGGISLPLIHLDFDPTPHLIQLRRQRLQLKLPNHQRGFELQGLVIH